MRVDNSRHSASTLAWRCFFFFHFQFIFSSTVVFYLHMWAYLCMHHVLFLRFFSCCILFHLRMSSGIFTHTYMQLTHVGTLVHDYMLIHLSNATKTKQKHNVHNINNNQHMESNGIRTMAKYFISCAFTFGALIIVSLNRLFFCQSFPSYTFPTNCWC